MAIHSSGGHVLCAPKCPEYAELVPAARIQELLGLLRSYYDYVIIDTPPFYNEVTLTAIEASSLILFIAGLDISILKNSKLSINLLNSLQQTDKIRVVVNRAANVGSITLDDVQKLIECPLWAKIPSDYKVAVTAINRGVPFVIGAPKSELARSVSTIASLIQNGGGPVDSLNPRLRKRLGLKRK
jgi:pilus assembly protein CpaE